MSTTKTVSPRKAIACAAFLTMSLAQAQTHAATPFPTILYTFLYPGDVGGPTGGLVADSTGALYGTAGFFNAGTVFQLAPPAASGGAWTRNTLYSFQGGADGEGPSNVVFGSNGELYGLTQYGGASSGCAYGCGTVYRLTAPAVSGGAWTKTVLYSFTGGSDGGVPVKAPLQLLNGALYGSTIEGGNGGGVVFELAPPTSPGGAWTESVLYALPGASSIYTGPATFGPDGNLYGTTGSGDVYQCIPPATPGGSWTASVIYTARSGVTLIAVTPGNIGELYGTTTGNVFRLKAPSVAGNPWTYRNLHTLNGGADGSLPLSGVLLYNGALYGTTVHGGGHDCGYQGCGTVYRLSPPSAPRGAWHEETLCRFSIKDETGTEPESLLMVNNGLLYGTAASGSASVEGSAFQLIP